MRLNSNVLTIEGYRTLDGIQRHRCSSSLIDETGRAQDYVNIKNVGAIPCNTVHIESGREICIPSDYFLKIVNEMGIMCWREASNVKAGDIIVGMSSQIRDGYYHYLPSISCDDAYVLGVLIADGSILENKIKFALPSYETNQKFLEHASKIYEMSDPTKLVGDVFYTNTLTDKDMVNSLYDRWNINGCLLDIPESVLRSSYKHRSSFLAGFLDCKLKRGYVDFSATIESRRRKLIFSLQLLLKSMGVNSIVTKNYTGSYLSINGHNLSRLYKNLGSEEWGACALIDKIIDGRETKYMDLAHGINRLVYSFYETLPKNMREEIDPLWIREVKLTDNSISKKRLLDLLVKGYTNDNLSSLLQEYTRDKYYFDKVTSVDHKEYKCGMFKLEGVKTFVLEGIICHV